MTNSEMLYSRNSTQLEPVHTEPNGDCWPFWTCNSRCS